MNPSQIESSRIGYMKRLMKKAASTTGAGKLQAYNKAIDYGCQYVCCLQRSDDMQKLIDEVSDQKKDYLAWLDVKAEISQERWELNKSKHKMLAEMGLPNHYAAIYR